MNQIVAFHLGAVIIAGAEAFAFGGEISPLDQTVLKTSHLDLVALGQSMYSENCVSWYCANLESQPNWQPPNLDGQLSAPPHDATSHTWHHNEDTMFRLLKYGTGAPVGHPNHEFNIPMCGRVLINSEIIAVLNLIKSIWAQTIHKSHNKMENR